MDTDTHDAGACKADADGAAPAMTGPTFAELSHAFARIGVLSFGGAAGQIALMHRIVVVEKGWLDERRFLHALNYCMLLPGPEAQQLATYVGWLTHGARGGLAAGLLFVAPGALLMLGLSCLYVLGAGLALVEGVFWGVQSAVLAIIAQALVTIGGRGLRTAPLIALAALAFAAMLLGASFPLVVLGAGVAGAMLPAVAVAAPGGPAEPPPPALSPAIRRDALIAAFGCLAAWWAPIALSAALLGADHAITGIGLFFSKLALLSFGGAYAVLAWLTQAAVAMGWATPAEMIAGLGLAETTPGPTILVNQFIAFLAALRDPGGLHPWVAATLGAAMATWATFAPSFLWILAGAPFVEALRRQRRLAGALAGVTAAVVGVIAVVALWFAQGALLPGGRPDWAAMALATLAGALVLRLRWRALAVVGLLAGLGATGRLAGL